MEQLTNTIKRFNLKNRIAMQRNILMAYKIDGEIIITDKIRDKPPLGLFRRLDEILMFCNEEFKYSTFRIGRYAITGGAIDETHLKELF